MKFLLPASLTNVIRGRISATNATNTLTFLACGAIIVHDESMADLRKLSMRYVIILTSYLSPTDALHSGLFAWVMGFGQAKFQPSLSNLFVADVALYWHIQGRSPINVVHDHQAIGAHTDVYLFYPSGSACRLLWSHPGRRPFGKPTPLQCPNPKCHSLKSWSKPVRVKEGREVVQFNLSCRHCGKTIEFHKEPSMTMLRETRVSKSERGNWYSQTI